VFEVTVDGRAVFSKKALRRFPAYQEIPTLIEEVPA
jgi:chorismate mutase